MVLYWLHGDSNRWKPFVGNRVSEITDILPAIHWRHVKGSENPADLISRGATPTQLLDNSLWFILNCRKSPDDRILTRLSMSELTEAHQAMIKYSQNLHFKEDVIQLRNHKQLIRTSQLQQLHAFLDENGILRVGGEAPCEAPWNFARKHPILLPAKCKITCLIIEREHCTLLHARPQLLLASIRRQYWPLNARNLICQICHVCVWCVKNNPKGLIQAMGSLPANRIQPSRAFLISGVHFAGPVITLVNKGRGRKTCKSYIALFVCFATKTVYLEAVSKLSTAAFLAALRRFVGRRALPRKICSDNATTFVGVNLKNFIHLFVPLSMEL
ncbi:uncharacterized protein LOC105203529 [Solenopsis invicta]|uniref:uncharacterized protein LOC105203529 n=1 Tax=Solenopsis invicta TaxID=13686 RepID=UPI0005958CC4|nr:uncharacterized protein LOC105203529 [Solenopsis invicta]